MGVKIGFWEIQKFIFRPKVLSSLTIFRRNPRHERLWRGGAVQGWQSAWTRAVACVGTAGKVELSQRETLVCCTVPTREFPDFRGPGMLAAAE